MTPEGPIATDVLYKPQPSCIWVTEFFTQFLEQEEDGSHWGRQAELGVGGPGVMKISHATTMPISGLLRSEFQALQSGLSGVPHHRSLWLDLQMVWG